MSTRRWRTQLKGLFAALSLFAGACDSGTLGDDLVVDVADQGEAVVVNLECERCVPSVRVEARFDPDAYVTAEDEVVFEQFRVDYDLDGVRGRVPYFAGVLQQSVRQNEDASFAVQVAGSAQREHLREASPDEDVQGRATITLAGYDSDDEQALIEVDVAIRFVHGSAEAAP